MIDLAQESPAAWLDAVMADFDAFLVDHAACERKASASAMAFVVRYPDRTYLLEPMIEVAREELEHFHQVYRLIHERGIRLPSDEKDHYVNGLLAHVRTGRQTRLLDRLILGGVLEARGCERFGKIAAALPTGDLKSFYQELTRSEARHYGLFFRLARHDFSDAEVDARVGYFLEVEAEVMAALPIRAALH